MGAILPLLRARRRAHPDLVPLFDEVLRGQIRRSWRYADVHVVTPRRFLRPKRWAEPGDALTMLLNVMVEAQRQAPGCAIGLAEALPLRRPPRLLLSHHTFDDDGYRRLRAAGTRVLHFKAGDLPGTVSFDSSGFAGWSAIADLDVRSLPALTPDVMALFEREREQVIATGRSKYAQEAVAHEPPLPAPYVFFAVQTIDDLVQRNAWLPMLDALRLVVAFFATRGQAVVIKRHPHCRSPAVAAAIADLTRQPHVRVTSRPIHEVLSGAAAMFTVNSGVGSEAMIHDVPVYAFGRSDYRAVAHEVKDAEDLARLADPIRPKVTREERIAFFHHYRHIYQTDWRNDLPAAMKRLLEETP